jgi:hypothetical protein
MEDRAPYFAAFCLSDTTEGKVTNFLFQNASNYDLDLPTVQAQIQGLYGAGILDAAAVERFNNFDPADYEDVPKHPAPETRLTYMYRVNENYPQPVGTIRYPDPLIPTCYIIISSTPIEGLEVIL